MSNELQQPGHATPPGRVYLYPPVGELYWPGPATPQSVTAVLATARTTACEDADRLAVNAARRLLATAPQPDRMNTGQLRGLLAKYQRHVHRLLVAVDSQTTASQGL